MLSLVFSTLLIIFFTAPCFWQPLVRCSAEEYRIIFSAERIGSTADTCAASVYEAFWKKLTYFPREGRLGHLFQHLLVRQWIQGCVSLRCSFAFQRNAWFDSGYRFASVYCAIRMSRNAWIDSGYKFASVYGALSCYNAMLGSTVDTYPQVQSLRKFQLLALPAGMRGRLFGALCIGTGPGVMSTGT